MSVLLLDEFEKASPDVHDHWLSAFDEGRLTDRFGRVTSLQSCVILLTSNVGSQGGPSLGFAGDDNDAIRRRFDKAVRDEFRIEMINRIDELLTFNPLSREAIVAIVQRELQLLAQRQTLVRRGLKLRWSEKTVSHLAALGFDPRYGARPLQRVIEQQLVAAIATKLIQSDQPTIDLDLLLELPGHALPGHAAARL